MKNEELIKKWLTDQLSEEEEKRLKKTDEYADMAKIWDGLEQAAPPHIDVARELDRFHSYRDQQATVIKVNWHQRLVGIAASVIFISVIAYVLFSLSDNTQDVILSENMTTFYLPDSSMVTLNKGSEIKYDGDEWSSSRKVLLKGEGFFQVKPGASFEVITTNETVRVLGTSFNVKKREKFFEVICYEGKVGVEASEQSLTLSAGDGYLATSDGGSQFQIAALIDKPEWLDGRSSFHRSPYYVVLNEIENQYNVSIEAKSIDLESTFTGSFPNDNLDVALSAITAPSGYSYERQDDQIVIEGQSKSTKN